MKAWFGEQVNGNWVPGGNTPDQLATFTSSLGSYDISKDTDMGQAAIKAGICSSQADYMAILHETAMALARKRIITALSGKDADIVQSIKALDTVIDAYNELTERLVEWYGIHHPEANVKPQELINILLKPVHVEAATGTLFSEIGILDSAVAPLSTDGADALRGYASTAQALFEERKRMEQYITGCMGDVAPNLSELLGPLLGARLIARAGGLEKLARLPGSTLQVMGAGEALFKHIREGTPSPKHGFIFRHPLISGSPKRLRGKMSRLIAGKAAIAARIDFYSGEQRHLADDVREKASAIRKRGRGVKDGR